MPEQIELLCSRWGLNPPTERETELLIRSGQLETCFFLARLCSLVLVFMDKDEDDAVTSRERVADFISGVMQARVNTPVGRADSGVMKCEYTVCDDCDASHFFSQFCIVKNTVSGHGFVI